MSENSNDKTFKWEKIPCIPTKRVFSTSLAVNKNIYVIGGCDEKGTPLNNFEVYKTEKRRWYRLAAMPTPRAGTVAMATDSAIYCFGGVSLSQAPLNNVEKYDLDKKEWTKLPPLKNELMGMSAVQRDGKIYLLGGMALNTDAKDFFTCFNEQASPQWQSCPKMPTSRYATSSFLINNKLYVIGGRQGKTPVDAFEVFDFEDMKWYQLPKVPSKRVFPCYTATDTHIFSLGGLNNNPTRQGTTYNPTRQGFSNVCEVFDIEKGEWTDCTAMSQVRGDFAAGILDGKVVVTGGLGNEGKPLDITEVYDLSINSWRTIGNLPTSHCSCTYVTLDNQIYVMGGLSAQGPSAACEVLTFRS